MARRSPGSASDVPDRIAAAVSRFGSAVGIRLRSGAGQAEASLTSPVERLLSEIADILALSLASHPEAAERSLGVRPDLAIDIDGARIGVVELKKNGRGVPDGPDWGDTAQTRKQWKQLQKLPNVLYTDGSQWAVYHYGKGPDRPATLAGDLRRAGSALRPADRTFEAAIKDFLYWQPSPPRDLSELIRISAGLCELLRDEVRVELDREQHGQADRLFLDHEEDWREWLFPDIADDEFADAYAQTVTFGLLLARQTGIHFEGLEITAIGDKLTKRHLLVGRALALLTARPDRQRSIEDRSIALQTMRRVIGAADWGQWPTEKTYHSLYEDFLETYDSSLRRQSGSYYTPTEIADSMTRLVDEVLESHLGIRAGLADDRVVVLDPAMGTGTFLQSVIDRVAARTTADQGDVPASLRDLLKRLIGFERQIGPFAVAELKLDQALEAHHAEAKDEDFSLFVADTLDDPGAEPLPRHPAPYKALAESRRGANDVKLKRDVTVVIGNPPYMTHAAHRGKWIVAGKPSLLDDFRSPGQGRFEHKLHDLAIYFWRWALWKAFQSTPGAPAGVVAFISTRGFLDGPGFAGMRAFLRRQVDEGWIIDLSSEGHRSGPETRIFPGVQHEVCIGIFARCGAADQTIPARIRHLTISGTQNEKFAGIQDASLRTGAWLDCPTSWTAPLRPAQAGPWTQFPAIEDLFPFTSLGVKPNRAWVTSPRQDVLDTRWSMLLSADRDEQRLLMKETRDRTIDWSSSLATDSHLTIAAEVPGRPKTARISYRSFDRQHLIADSRVVDFLRRDLWSVNGPAQVFLVTQLREPLTNGPASVFTTQVPDTHSFNGRGGRVLPLWLDNAGTLINATPGVLNAIEARLSTTVAETELMEYVAGVTTHSGYTARFTDELRQPGVRIPLTADPTLWREAAEIGRTVIWLHTYGERYVDPEMGRPSGQPLRHRPGIVGSVGPRFEDMPKAFVHRSGQIDLGTAQIGPVSDAAAAYEVSGMRVIKHWFDYRKQKASGRRSSPLDDVVPRQWSRSTTEELRDLVAVVEGCIELEDRQDDLLGRIVQGPLISVDDLEGAGVLPVAPEARRLPVQRDGMLF